MLTDKHPQMRDSQMPLVERIDAAINRITHGDCNMRIPVEATDPDIVLADCKSEIALLKAALRWTMKYTSLHRDPSGNWSQLDYHPSEVTVPAEFEAVIAEAAGRSGND